MMTAEPKTNVKVSVDEGDSLIDVMKKTIRALRISGTAQESQDFQREVTSGHKNFMEVVKEWVTIES